VRLQVEENGAFHGLARRRRSGFPSSRGFAAHVRPLYVMTEGRW
jgi:hypothetical protein